MREERIENAARASPPPAPRYRRRSPACRNARACIAELAQQRLGILRVEFAGPRDQTCSLFNRSGNAWINADRLMRQHRHDQNQNEREDEDDAEE